MTDPSLTTPPAVPSWAPVPPAPAALAEAHRALAGTSMSGAAKLVVTALNTADMLQTPGENAGLRGLVARATGYSALYRQTCENQQHREWFADVAELMACPWCELARLQSYAGHAYRVARSGLVIGTYTSPEVAGTHAETELRLAYPNASCQWTPHPDAEGVMVLNLLVDEMFQPTGYSVTTIEVLDAYDPEADA